MAEDKKNQIIGNWYAIAAFLAWGVLPVYWKALKEVPASEILPHRIIWSFVFLALFNSVKKRWPDITRAYLHGANRLSSLLSALFVGTNWFIFIWAVNADHIIEISLGYYINPLLMVLFGVFLLRERLAFWEVVAFFLALIGVAYMTIQLGRIPWIALSLAVTFGFYGLLRKTSHVGSLTGLMAETAILSPVAAGFLIYLMIQGSSVTGNTTLSVHLLLLGAGIVTATPLVWFTRGARKMPLSSVGFLQYLAPTCQLLLGVFLYKEPFTRVHVISFSLIWIALVIFSVSRIKFLRRMNATSTS